MESSDAWQPVRGAAPRQAVARGGGASSRHPSRRTEEAGTTPGKRHTHAPITTTDTPRRRGQEAWRRKR